MDKKILLRHLDVPEINQLDVYRQNDGFKAFEKAITSMKPADVTGGGESFRITRPWWSRFSHWNQMELFTKR